MFNYFRNSSSNPITFAVKIVQRKVHISFSQFDDIDLHSKSHLRLKLDNIYLCYNSNNSDNV